MAESSNSTARSGGIGFLGLLAIVFITLKLTAVQPVAAWSWWWVLSPLWGGAALAISFVFLGLLFVGGCIAVGGIAGHFKK